MKFFMLRTVEKLLIEIDEKQKTSEDFVCVWELKGLWLRLCNFFSSWYVEYFNLLILKCFKNCGWGGDMT